MSLTDEDRQWIREQMRGQLNENRLWIREQLEALETRLLTEFHKWASPTEMRLRSHSATLRALDLELESVSDRVKILEERKPNG